MSQKLARKAVETLLKESSKSSNPKKSSAKPSLSTLNDSSTKIKRNVPNRVNFRKDERTKLAKRRRAREESRRQEVLRVGATVESEVHVEDIVEKNLSYFKRKTMTVKQREAMAKVKGLGGLITT